VYQLSPNIELLFTEAGANLADRVSAAASAGFDAVEMWGTSGRDVWSLRDRLRDTGVALTSVIAEPRTNFTLPGTDLGPFFDGLDRGIEDARALNCQRIVLGSGVGFPGARRGPQLDRLIDVFSQAVQRTEGSGVKLILEPVNTRVDHPGALLDRTADAVYIARGVASDRFGLLYDMYHSITEGEDPAAELGNAGALVDYVQIADSPGRGEPGTGKIDWPAQLAVLRQSGYAGPLGLEYFPTVESIASLDQIKGVAATV
jgi:hydroxypyruvate isomerase